MQAKEKRIMSMEERLSRIEGFLEQLDKRVGGVETEIRSVRDKLDNQFKWVVGLLLTIIGATLLK